MTRSMWQRWFSRPDRFARRLRPAVEVLEDRTLLASAISYSQQVLADGPAAYYRLGEAPGATTAVDATGHGFNGTYKGGITLGLPGALPSDTDTSAGFNGSGAANSYVAMGTPAGLQPGAQLTIEAWIYPTAYVSGEIIVNKENQYEVSVKGDGVNNTIQWAIQNTNVNWAWTDTGFSPALNQWSHIVLSYSNGTMTTFANGAQISVTSFGSGAVRTDINSELRIGARAGDVVTNPPTFVWNGQLDEVAIYNKTFTLAQALNHYYLSANPGIFFGPPSSVPSGNTSSAYFVATGDFNGDGKSDLAVLDATSSTMSILLGNGAGAFALAQNLATGAGPNGLAVADFNGDGKLDIAVANYTGSSVSIFLGTGTGTFAPAAGSPISGGLFNGPADLVAADYNGDGKIDLAVMNDGTNNITLLLGSGTGTFAPAAGSPFAAGGRGNNYLKGADVNNDGKPDLVQPNFFNNTVSVLLGSGIGSLSQAPGSPFAAGVGSQPQDVAIGDFNGDGKLDFALTNSNSNTLSVFLGNGDGTFAATAQTPLATGARPVGIATTDLNGDGKLDLVLINSNTSSLSAYLGHGDGTFADFRDIPLPNNGFDVALADFNGDGAPDTVVGYSNSPNLSVFLNEGGTRTTLTSALNPSSFGQNVTFTATVAAAVGGAPQVVSGNVSFFDGTTLLGTGAVNASGQATFSTNALTGGAHSITASYSDTNGFFYKSTSAILTETVNQAATTTTLTSSPNPGVSNQPITFTASVTGPGPTPPSGTVTFLDGGTPIGTGTLSGGKATLKVTLPAGSHSITAVYNGDTNYLTSTSAPLAETVNSATPPPLGIYAVGADAGTVAQVNVYDARTGALKFILLPFGTAFRGGVRVAVGDVNGDGVGDIICAAGPGGLPEVVVYDGVTGTAIRTFFAFGTATSALTAGSPSVTSNLGNISPFTGGLYVAAGDVNHDGFADIIIGAGPGTSPQVQVWDGQTGNLLANFYAFGTPQFRGGVRVTAGDVNGDGYADLILAAGVGGGPQVEVINVRNSSVLANFYAFGAARFGGGVWVGTGDVNGDGIADIICGSGVSPQVTVYDVAHQNVLANFYAFNAQNYFSGVRVAARDLNGDGKADILAVPGPGLPSETVGFDAATLALISNFYAFSLVGFNGGAYVG